MKRLIITAALVLLSYGVAFADDDAEFTGTLKTILARGTILVGYRTTALPFSFLNKAGQPIGFSVDICHAIAEDVARALHRDLLEPDAASWQSGVRIVYVPVAAEERLPKLVSGAIDLECGSTTANAERAKTVAFSPVFFLSGTKLLVRSNSDIASSRDLSGRTIVVGTGTTNAETLHRLAGRTSPTINVVEAANLDAAFDMLVDGKVDAFASDDILLAGYIATRPAAKNFAIIGDYLSFEPYAIGLRRDDPDFANLVKQSFERLAREGTLAHLYERWLVDRLPTGQTLGVPMNPYLAAMYQSLGQSD